jgi:hypothetical protein
MKLRFLTELEMARRGFEDEWRKAVHSSRDEHVCRVRMALGDGSRLCPSKSPRVRKAGWGLFSFNIIGSASDEAIARIDLRHGDECGRESVLCNSV